jgi:hypothetical protein
MSKAITYFNSDRYYTFNRDGKFWVGYFYRGSNLQHTCEFDTAEQLAEWVKENLGGFYPVSPSVTGS